MYRCQERKHVELQSCLCNYMKTLTTASGFTGTLGTVLYRTGTVHTGTGTVLYL